MSDIASFVPSVGQQGMEPNGWAILGLDANFFANAARHEVSGTLLGEAAAVRFTPVGFRWDYGDGQSRDSATPGASWAALGLREFDPTPTSHVFEAEGTFTVRLTVSFAAEYKFAGGSWTPVIGAVSGEAPPLTVLVSDAKTVLVGQDCRQNPAGPGC